MMMLRVLLLLSVWLSLALAEAGPGVVGEEEDWGEGLRVLVTYRPEDCSQRARTGDVIHYHYVGRLASDGKIFGKSFDYDSPYIVALGYGRIIAGMDRGLQGTCLWERRRITFPPSLGYGEAGVGVIIPPNATLVFYIRMVKIEREGVSVEEEGSFSDAYNVGLRAYTNEQWESARDSLEEAVQLYHTYINRSLECLINCGGMSADSHMTQEESQLAGGFNREFPYITEYLNMAVRGACVAKCKAESMSPRMRAPESATLQLMRRGKAYSYLHYAYYQLGDVEEATRCSFSHAFLDPEDPTTKRNLPLYRGEMGLARDQFVWRPEVPGVKESTRLYLEGADQYENEEWGRCAASFEESFHLQMEEMQNCRYLCEDSLYINLTSVAMTTDEAAILARFDFMPDSKEFPLLLGRLVTEVLQCRHDCWAEAERLNTTRLDGMLTTTLNYLQFCNFKVDRYELATQYASTHHTVMPSDDVMESNLNWYRVNLNLTEENYQPLQAVVDLFTKSQTELRLLKFAQIGKPVKKLGKRGDEAVLHSHSEL